LNISKEDKFGDWHLYQKYTKIQIYGCEIPPNRLPFFVPIRILSLEYSRQTLNMDELYFVLNKKKPQFKLKAHVGPYIVNTRATKKSSGGNIKADEI